MSNDSALARQLADRIAAIRAVPHKHEKVLRDAESLLRKWPEPVPLCQNMMGVGVQRLLCQYPKGHAGTCYYTRAMTASPQEGR